jgi:hypothetical protein
MSINTIDLFPFIFYASEEMKKRCGQVIYDLAKAKFNVWRDKCTAEGCTSDVPMCGFEFYLNTCNSWCWMHYFEEAEKELYGDMPIGSDEWQFT